MSEQQRVVVTGGASGIGLAIAQRFLAAGARVFVCDSARQRLESAFEDNPELQGALADVGHYRQVQAFFKEAKTALGGVDVLVNNVGIVGPRAHIEHIDDEEWDVCIRINLSSMFYCVKQVVADMKIQGGGCIINISTSSAKTGLPRRLPYVVAKAGVLGLSHNLARELGPYGIRCNSILPGFVDNARGRGLIESFAKENDRTIENAQQEFLQYISMRTMIQPAEIGDMAVFLASDAARHVTAQEIAVDGNSEWET